jgi:hypothetical protein
VVNEGDAVFQLSEVSQRVAGDTVEGLVALLEADPLFDEDEIT